MIYIDRATNPYGRMKMSHMMADTLPELLDMVDAIGVKRKWLQWDKSGTVGRTSISVSRSAV